MAVILTTHNIDHKFVKNEYANFASHSFVHSYKRFYDLVSSTEPAISHFRKFHLHVSGVLAIYLKLFIYLNPYINVKTLAVQLEAWAVR